LDSYNPKATYLLEEGCEDPWLFLEHIGVRDLKCLGNVDVEEG